MSKVIGVDHYTDFDQYDRRIKHASGEARYYPIVAVVRAGLLIEYDELEPVHTAEAAEEAAKKEADMIAAEYGIPEVWTPRK
jgi:hypothetical protein